MTKIRFFKYQGTGNDFIIVDNRQLHWRPAGDAVSRLCDRRFGIGADGFMLLGEQPGFDFTMTYYNSDGNESTMCGNGGRCMTAFASSLGLVGNRAFFNAVDGEHHAEIRDDGAGRIYRVKMKDPRPEKKFEDGYFIDTGSPHFVTFVKDAAKTDVAGLGRMIRKDDRFSPGGTNVDFVEYREKGLFVRTYERGVENETLSCGTGVTASALVAASLHPGNPGFYEIETPGGFLKVSFVRKDDLFSEVWLEGPAERVFEGEIDRM